MLDRYLLRKIPSEFWNFGRSFSVFAKRQYTLVTSYFGSDRTNTCSLWSVRHESNFGLRKIFEDLIDSIDSNVLAYSVEGHFHERNLCAEKVVDTFRYSIEYPVTVAFG